MRETDSYKWEKIVYRKEQRLQTRLDVEIQKQLKKRQWGEVIRLEVEASVDKKLLRFLKDELKVAEEDIFQISGPIDLTFLMKMYGLSGCDSL